MNEPARSHRPIAVSLLLVLAVAAIVGLAGLRAVNLDADPPAGVTTSGVLFTDEGWYSRNALSHYLGGPWIVPGDFNPVINMPVLQVVNYFFFKALGMSFTSARLPGVIAFAATLLLLFLALRRRMILEAAVVTLLLLAANFLFFAFSRVAIAENLMVMFIAASFCFGVASHRRMPALNTALAALCLAAAVLTKMTALFFLPVLLYIMWGFHAESGAGGAERMRSFIGRAVGIVAILAAVLGTYYLLAIRPHIGEFRYFNELNIARRIRPFGDNDAIVKAIFVVKGSSLRFVGVSFVVYVAGMMSMLLVLFSRRLKRDPVMVTMVLWILCYLAIAAVNGYAPPRYYMPVIIPCTVLLAGITFWLPRAVEGRVLAPGLAAVGIVLMGLSLTLNTREIVRYVRAPAYTFKSMARHIGARARYDTGGRAAIIGHFANSISIEAGIPSYNDAFKTWPIDSLMAVYEPSYYVCYGAIEKTNPLDETYKSALYIAKNFNLVEIAEYDVLGNYYRKQPVHLYRIEKKVIRPDESAGGDADNPALAIN